MKKLIFISLLLPSCTAMLVWFDPPKKSDYLKEIKEMPFATFIPTNSIYLARESKCDGRVRVIQFRNDTVFHYNFADDTTDNIYIDFIKRYSLTKNPLRFRDFGFLKKTGTDTFAYEQRERFNPGVNQLLRFNLIRLNDSTIKCIYVKTSFYKLFQKPRIDDCLDTVNYFHLKYSPKKSRPDN